MTKLAKIIKVKYYNTNTGKYENRYRVGNSKRKFSPLYYTKKSALKMRHKFG